MLALTNALYSLLYTLSLLVYLPLFAYRLIFEKKHRIDWLQRLGLRPPAAEGAPAGPVVWIHAVSVGEVNVVRPLVKQLGLGPRQLWISTTTDTGQALAQRLFQEVARVFYFPLDWKWACRRYLLALRPAVVLLVETELWPGFIAAAKSLSIPVLVINGRISDTSFRRYGRIRFLLKPLLQQIERFCMQSRLDKERILQLGAPAERVRQVGNLKYDYHLPPSPEKERLVERMERLLKRGQEDPLWVCGSTREGEEEILLSAFRDLRAEFPSLALLIAPRHPHRGEGIARLVRSQGWNCVRRSEFVETEGDGWEETRLPARPDVLILDSIGEIAYLYQLAEVVFIGGSLVPTGGHNVIEPAYFGKPILFGPHMENFREISTTFLESYAALQVASAGELAAQVRELLKDPVTRRWLGRNARKVIRDNQGAVKRTIEAVARYTGPLKAVNAHD